MSKVRTTDGSIQDYTQDEIVNALNNDQWFNYGPDEQPTINIIKPGGETVSVDFTAENMRQTLSSGWKLESRQQEYSGWLQQEYGSGTGELSAALLGAARGATFGLSDVIAGEIWSPEELNAWSTANPGISMASEITGAIAPILASGGAGVGATAAKAGGKFLPALTTGAKVRKAFGALPTSQLAKLGSGIERKLLEGGLKGLATGKSFPGRLAGQALARATAYGVEGAAYGAGAGLSEAVLQGDPVLSEKTLAHMGWGTLLGAGLGAVPGTLATLVRGERRIIPGTGQLRSPFNLDDVKESSIKSILEATTGSSDDALRIVEKGSWDDIVREADAFKKTLDIRRKLVKDPEIFSAQVRRRKTGSIKFDIAEGPDFLKSPFLEEYNKLSEPLQAKYRKLLEIHELIEIDQHLLKAANVETIGLTQARKNVTKFYKDVKEANELFKKNMAIPHTVKDTARYMKVNDDLLADAAEKYLPARGKLKADYKTKAPHPVLDTEESFALWFKKYKADKPRLIEELKREEEILATVKVGDLDETYRKAAIQKTEARIDFLRKTIGLEDAPLRTPHMRAKKIKPGWTEFENNEFLMLENAGRVHAIFDKVGGRFMELEGTKPAFYTKWLKSKKSQLELMIGLSPMREGTVAIKSLKGVEKRFSLEAPVLKPKAMSETKLNTIRQRIRSRIKSLLARPDAGAKTFAQYGKEGKGMFGTHHNAEVLWNEFFLAGKAGKEIENAFGAMRKAELGTILRHRADYPNYAEGLDDIITKHFGVDPLKIEGPIYKGLKKPIAWAAGIGKTAEQKGTIRGAITGPAGERMEASEFRELLLKGTIEKDGKRITLDELMKGAPKTVGQQLLPIAKLVSGRTGLGGLAGYGAGGPMGAAVGMLASRLTEPINIIRGLNYVDRIAKKLMDKGIKRAFDFTRVPLTAPAVKLSVKEESNLFQKYKEALEKNTPETISHGINKQLQTLDNVSPVLQQQVQDNAMAIRQFLLENTPKMKTPSTVDMIDGKTPSKPVDMAEVIQWNRYWKIANNPFAALGFLSDKSLTTRDVEFLKANYMGLWMEMSEGLITELKNVKGLVPYKDQLLLSRFTGVDIASGLQHGAELIAMAGPPATAPGPGPGPKPKTKKSKMKIDDIRTQNMSKSDAVLERDITGK